MGIVLIKLADQITQYENLHFVKDEVENQESKKSNGDLCPIIEWV